MKIIILLIAAVALGAGIFYLSSNAAPSQPEPVANASGITGSVLLGPTCPVVRDPPDPGCADKPYKTALTLTTLNAAKTVASFSSNDAGRFSVNVAPGDYEIHPAAGSPMLPRCGSNGTIHVNKGEFATTTVYCDSGIR